MDSWKTEKFFPGIMLSARQSRRRDNAVRDNHLGEDMGFVAGISSCLLHLSFLSFFVRPLIV